MNKRVTGKILASVMIATMVVGMTACGSNGNQAASSGAGEGTADSDISVGIVLKTATNAH